MARTKIKLIVEAASLLDIPNPSEEEVLNHCSMEDDKGNRADDVAIKTCLIPVDRDQDVRWEGIAVENGQHTVIDTEESWKYSVGIDLIVFLKKDLEKNFFDRVVLEGNGGKNSKVTAKVKKDGIIKDDKYTYLIVFSVYGPNKKWATFAIDPKLSANN